MPTVVPVTKSGSEPERCGVMLEALAAAYYNLPACCNVVLQYKVARDEESQGMLDIIFASRVIDIGDSTLCGRLRDDVLRNLFESKGTNLASPAKTQEKVINKTFSKLPGVGDKENGGRGNDARPEESESSRRGRFRPHAFPALPPRSPSPLFRPDGPHRSPKRPRQ